jgi:hypothetical protein
VIPLLAAIAWDPQVRGTVIVLTSIVILCGSVYLLLATNTGMKVGFLLAAAGLAGWMALMAISWVIYGIGLKGEPPHWKVLEVINGDLEELATEDVVAGFPKGWKVLPPGDPILGVAQASADKVLAPSEGGEEGHATGEEAGAEAAEEFDPVFRSLDDFVPMGGYRKGGEDYFLPGGFLERNSGFLQGWFHKPHYVVIQVAPALEEPDLGGAPPPPAPDTTKPLTSVLMVRDLGNLRFPSFLVLVASTIIFGIICNVLHRRDKEIMAARAAGAASG